MTEQDKVTDQPDLALVLATLRREYKELHARIETLEHTVTCGCETVTLRMHYPKFRDGECTVAELVEVISLYLAPFALPRAEVEAVDALYGTLPAAQFRLKASALEQRAARLFQQAQHATDRNGEAGELLLYLLTEWVLEAPQLLAKMSLKTNRAMPVHGADGVHVRYNSKNKTLCFYWGESKLHADLGKGIQSAITSIVESLTPSKLTYELELVQRNLALTGLPDEAMSAIVKHLDPFEEESNQRINTTTALVGFNFSGFAKLQSQKKADIPEIFKALALNQVTELAPRIAKALKTPKLTSTR